MHTVGELPAEGTSVPAFDLVGADLGPVASDEFTGQRMVLNIFPSLDTGVCAQSVREFNKRASELQNTAVLCVSKDLPFAQARFCGAEGLDNVVTASAFRSSFGEDYGVTMTDGPLEGLLARRGGRGRERPGGPRPARPRDHRRTGLRRRRGRPVLTRQLPRRTGD